MQVFLFFRLFHFNPCPHTGATPDHVLPLPGGSHFNPRPHTGATSLRPSVQRPGSISIHAPIRGRPEAGVRRVPIARHFNPRPLAGATHPDPGCGRARCNFNPRPLAGATQLRHHCPSQQLISIHAPLRGRLVVLLQDGLLFPISIHAPLRERREHPLHFFYKGKFQSTPPCGGDFGFHGSPSHELTFQSTPPCGGDPEPIINADQLKNFNPRPLAGATGRDGTQLDGARISIHAPLRGRPRKPWLTLLHHQFQSTPPCGGDAAGSSRRDTTTNFNPRPLAGATLRRALIYPRSDDFNPRPLAGATRNVLSG